MNLYLRIVGKRADGYHDIETVLQTISLTDELSVSLAPITRVVYDPHFQFRRDLVFEVCAQYGVSAQVSVAKNIPVAAGLGGGSSDAASTLLALQRLSPRDVDLGSLASRVGSDVAFFLTGGVAQAAGRGEVVRSIKCRNSLWWVLGVAHDGLLTADVYAAWDALQRSPVGGDASEIVAALDGGDPREIGALLRNDLQTAATWLRPELEAGLKDFRAAGAVGAVVSGSGPTIAALCVDEAHALRVSEAVRGRFFDVRIVVGASN